MHGILTHDTPTTGDQGGAIASTESVAAAFGVLASPVVAEALGCIRELDCHAEPEVLHRLRITMRRLRALWWAYLPLLEKRSARAQRNEFRSLADGAGTIRDWDVLSALLVDLEADRPSASIASLKRWVSEHRTHAQSASRKTIGDSDAERFLHHALTNAQHQLDLRDTNLTLAAFARRRVKQAKKNLRKRVKGLSRSRHPDYAELHKVRIAGKKLRYLLEFFAPVLDRDHRRMMRKLTSVQEALGRLNDTVVSETLVRQKGFHTGNQDDAMAIKKRLNARKRHHMHVAQRMLRKFG